MTSILNGGIAGVADFVISLFGIVLIGHILLAAYQ
jgi:hypothetical protein